MFALKRYIYMFMYNMFVLLILLLVNQNLCDTCIFADLSLKVPLDIMGLKKKFIFVVAEKILHYNNPTPKHTVCFIPKKEIFKKNVYLFGVCFIFIIYISFFS